ncbi:MAG: response regulator [Terriglobales bacterium]
MPPTSSILCIDDRPPMLALRKTDLETQGYSVMVASTGHTGLKMLAKNKVDAVLIEYRQEGMDAQAVAYHIKQRYPEQAIILLSAYSEMPEAILWLVDEYVMRSEPVERLGQVIEKLTRSSQKIKPQSHVLSRHRSATA